MTEPTWKIFDSASLVEQTQSKRSPYLEFLRVPALSSGIYILPAGATDLQTPHDEDEVYFVISGRARVRVDGKEHEITAGNILYVAATAEHSFFEIEEELTLLVFFASGGSSEL